MGKPFILDYGEEPEKRLTNLKYYYKNPDATLGDPCCIIGNNRTGKYGEIIIGNEEPDINHWSPNHILRNLESMTVYAWMYSTVIHQSWYFGEDNYKPARQAIIDLTKKVYFRAQELNLDVSQEVRDIIENDNWPW